MGIQNESTSGGITSPDLQHYGFLKSGQREDILQYLLGPYKSMLPEMLRVGKLLYGFAETFRTGDAAKFSDAERFLFLAGEAYMSVANASGARSLMGLRKKEPRYAMYIALPAYALAGVGIQIPYPGEGTHTLSPSDYEALRLELAPVNENLYCADQIMQEVGSRKTLTEDDIRILALTLSAQTNVSPDQSLPASIQLLDQVGYRLLSGVRIPGVA